jgi:hypothetical protein
MGDSNWYNGSQGWTVSEGVKARGHLGDCMQQARDSRQRTAPGDSSWGTVTGRKQPGGQSVKVSKPGDI